MSHFFKLSGALELLYAVRLRVHTRLRPVAAAGVATFKVCESKPEPWVSVFVRI